MNLGRNIKLIKLIIFDLDGVLVETKDIHFRALNSAIKKYKFYLTLISVKSILVIVLCITRKVYIKQL